MSDTDFNWNEFIQDKIYPVLFDRINEAFPNFEFKRYRYLFLFDRIKMSYKEEFLL